jgi:hypothetical protein
MMEVRLAPRSVAAFMLAGLSRLSYPNKSRSHGMSGRSAGGMG